MQKYAFIFPGQGSQYVEMGKDFYDNFQLAKEIFEEANDVLKLDLKKLCFEGPLEELTQTENAQPAILTVSYMANRIFESEFGIESEITAGHSLGEFTALVYAGALKFGDAVSLVRKRGEFINEACKDVSGTMAAIIGLEREKVESICEKLSAEGVIQPANYNSNQQIVISGEKDLIIKAVEEAKIQGAKVAKELTVSGPFHSSLLKPAGEWLFEEMNKLKIENPNKIVITNSTAKEVSTSEEIKVALKNQLFSPVFWVDSMLKIKEKGYTNFIEFGPKNILKGLNRKIDKSLKTISIGDTTSLRKFNI